LAFSPPVNHTSLLISSLEMSFISSGTAYTLLLSFDENLTFFVAEEKRVWGLSLTSLDDAAETQLS
jgi:hypothetical protein